MMYLFFCVKHPAEATLSAAGCFAIGVFYCAPMLVSELHPLSVFLKNTFATKVLKTKSNEIQFQKLSLFSYQRDCHINFRSRYDVFFCVKHPVEATLFAAGCFAIGVFYRAPMLSSLIG